MNRKINETFLEELKQSPLLDYVRKDHTLDLELRGSCVMLYYRGGKILELSSKGEMKGLDPEYLTSKYKKYFEDVKNQPSLENIEDYIPKAKHIIDFYVTIRRNHLWEKEIQQRVVMENNYSPNSSDTDFFIIDMEYQDSGKRFDIVALRWDSSPAARKLSKGHLPKITIFEVKQGCNSINGDSGIYEHLKDFKEFVDAKNTAEDFKKDMIDVFNQKIRLGLMGKGKHTNKEIKKIDEDIDFVLLLANYKPASMQLRNALRDISVKNREIRPQFIVSNPMGYGLYAKNIFHAEAFPSPWKFHA